MNQQNPLLTHISDEKDELGKEDAFGFGIGVFMVASAHIFVKPNQYSESRVYGKR